MSRGTPQRIVGFAIAFSTIACSAQPGEGNLTSIPIEETSSQSRLPQSASPSSLGWQDQARTLVAVNNMSPVAAARVYAALSIAQYSAVTTVNDSGVNAELPANGLQAGGRRTLEANRGAVAGASAQVLTFFFPASATALEQRVAMEGEATPGNAHPHFTRGVNVGRAAGSAMVERLNND